MIYYIGRVNQQMTFGEALKKARMEVGLTQKELAKLLNVSYSSINRYENGHHVPTRIVNEAVKGFFKKKGIVFVYDDREG